MLVSGSVKTDKYVSLTNLRDYVFLTPSSSFTPYTSAFKTFYRGADSGNTKNHHLTHQQAEGYGFVLHEHEYQAVDLPNKLCLPEEMTALNPFIYFGGTASLGGTLRPNYSFTVDDSISIRAILLVSFKNRRTVTVEFDSAALSGTANVSGSLSGKFTSKYFNSNGSQITLSQVQAYGEVSDVLVDNIILEQHHPELANYTLASYQDTGTIFVCSTKSPSAPTSSTKMSKWAITLDHHSHDIENNAITGQVIKNFNASGLSNEDFYLYFSLEPAITMTLTQSGFQFPWYVRVEYGATNVQHPAYTVTFNLLGTGSTVLDTQTVTLSANMNASNAFKSVTVPNSLANTNIRFSVSSISPTPPYGYTTYAEKNNSTVTNMTFTAATQSAYTSVVNITYESPEFSMRIQTRGGFESGSPGTYDTFHNVDVSKIGYDRSDVFSESATFEGTVVDNYFVYGSYVDITATTNETLYFTFSNPLSEGWTEVGIFDGDNTTLVAPVKRESMGYTGKFSWQVSGRPSVIYIDFDFRD